MQIANQTNQIISTNYTYASPKSQDKNANQKNLANLGADTSDKTSLQEAQAKETQSKELQAKKVQSEKESALEKTKEPSQSRITYGLKVLELMSEQEYQAFLWASDGLSDAEKIRMAQSLYRFTEFYQGRSKQESGLDSEKSRALNQKDRQNQQDIYQQDLRKLEAQKAFGIDEGMQNDLINRYKNAYSRVLEMGV